MSNDGGQLGSSLAKLKAQSEARQAAKDRDETLKKSLLVLILDYLQTQGYSRVVQLLESTTNLSLQELTVADNIDLPTIVQEFSAYYSLKFGRVPRLLRRPDSGTDVGGGMKVRRRDSAEQKALKEPKVGNADIAEPKFNVKVEAKLGKEGAAEKSNNQKKVAQPALKANEQTLKDPVAQFVEDSLAKHGSNGNIPGWLQHWSKANGISAGASRESTTENSAASDCQVDNSRGSDQNVTLTPSAHINDLKAQNFVKTLKPLPLFGNSEYQELAETIQRDIFLKNPNVKLTEIAGLKDAKRLIQEAVVYPIKYPELFESLGGAWRGILLYGPPGTGKTMLAKAVATECQTTLFNISASTIVSKWRGDSEKLVRVLFEMARHYSPSLIFVDEIESIMGHRGGSGSDGTASEHEGSLRMKTELLIQLDGLSRTSGHVVLLAASNLPWLLDQALLRRLDKRIMVGLPDSEARAQIMRSKLSDFSSNLCFGALSQLTEGYSGSDLELVCKEAKMRPIRRVIDILEKGLYDTEVQTLKSLVKPVDQDDVFAAINSTRATSAVDTNAKYREWSELYSSV